MIRTTSIFAAAYFLGASASPLSICSDGADVTSASCAATVTGFYADFSGQAPTYGIPPTVWDLTTCADTNHKMTPKSQNHVWIDNIAKSCCATKLSACHSFESKASMCEDSTKYTPNKDKSVGDTTATCKDIVSYFEPLQATTFSLKTCVSKPTFITNAMTVYEYLDFFKATCCSGSASACDNACPAGHHVVKNYPDVECKSCIAGYYSTAAFSTMCTKCEAGKFTSSVGSTACTSCPVGKYSAVIGAGVCMACAPGHFAGYRNMHDMNHSPPIAPGWTECYDCKAGKYAAASGADACADCAAGMYQMVEMMTSCTACEAGKFQAKAGMAECIDCKAGLWSKRVASDNWTYCWECKAGSYSMAGATTCTDCPLGTFQDMPAKGTCKTCKPGFYAAHTNAVHCKVCQPGTYSNSPAERGSTVCLTCLAGTFSTKGASMCTECAAGTYAATASSMECKKCPKGETSAVGAKICSMAAAIRLRRAE